MIKFRRGIFYIFIASLSIFSLVKTYANVKKEAGTTFENWSVICETLNQVKDPKNKDASLSKPQKTCYLAQTITEQNTKDKESKEVKKLLELRIGYFGSDKQLSIVQITPLGILIQPGTTLIANKKTSVPAKFVACYPYGCIASAPITEAELKQIYETKDENLFLGVIAADTATQINIPFSSKGLQKGLEHYLKTYKK